MTIESVAIALHIDGRKDAKGTQRRRRSNRGDGWFSIVAISLYFSCCNYGAKKDIGQAVGKMAGDIPGKRDLTAYPGHHFATDSLWPKNSKEPSRKISYQKTPDTCFGR